MVHQPTGGWRAEQITAGLLLRADYGPYSHCPEPSRPFQEGVISPTLHTRKQAQRDKVAG